jgi:hypothetical protein
MKKILLLVLLAVGASPAAFAQARAGGELSSKDYTGGGSTDSRNTGFGFKGGYNYARAYGDGVKDLKLNGSNTFHVGAYGQFGFNEFASVQAEVLYNRKGFKLDGAGTEGDLRLDYLSVPILFVGNVTETLSFHVGPQISVLTKVMQGDEDIAIADNGYNAIDFGGVAGVEARVGPARVGARYDLGFGKIFDTESSKSGVTERVSNSTLQLYIGIGFTQ